MLEFLCRENIGKLIKVEGGYYKIANHKDFGLVLEPYSFHLAVKEIDIEPGILLKQFLGFIDIIGESEQYLSINLFKKIDIYEPFRFSKKSIYAKI